MENEEYIDYEEVQDPRDSVITETPQEKTDVEKHQSEEDRKREEIKEMMTNEDFQRTFMKLHTPLTATKLPGRNDICPFCDSGKKFKNCECYKTHKVEYKNKYFKD